MNDALAGSVVLASMLGACGSRTGLSADLASSGQAASAAGTGASQTSGSSGAAGASGSSGAAGASGAAGGSESAAGSASGAPVCLSGDRRCSDGAVVSCLCLPTAPPSCAASGKGLGDCGPSGESCCTSLDVPGGTFFRSYDGVTFTDKSYPATVSDFRLDKYEVTVARFREFMNTVDGGWRPAAGAGKHTHLNGGQGLADILSPGKFETGWDTNQNTDLAMCSVLDCWQKVLWAGGGGNKYATWSTLPGASDSRPIVGETWAEAYAFCIWDGGFLPSEAEWNYAASGGPEQRVYPWSSPPMVTSIDCSYANYGGPSFPQSACVPGGMDDVGSQSPKGDGKWGHADLAGNTAEWMLDWWAVYVNPSIDAATAGPQPSQPEVPVARSVRGGAMDGTRDQLLASSRNNYPPTFRTYDLGLRCARAP